MKEKMCVVVSFLSFHFLRTMGLVQLIVRETVVVKDTEEFLVFVRINYNTYNVR